MTSEVSRKNYMLGRTALFAMTIIWGTSFVILKNTLDSVPTLYVMAYRFTGAAALMCLIGIRELKKLDREYLKGGIIIGVCLFLAYVLQTYGLVFTTPGKNAFLTATYCVLTPFLVWLIYKIRPNAYNVLAAVICIAGIGLVSLEGDFSIGIGDLLTICCGLFFALHIIATSKYVRGRSVVLLTMVQFFVAGALSWIFALSTEPIPRGVPADAYLGIAYLCVMCTALCFLLQSWGQKFAPASTTAIIMSFEAVFGALISAIFYNEKMAPRVIAGFVLIFAAMLVSETQLSFIKRKRGIKRG